MIHEEMHPYERVSELDQVFYEEEHLKVKLLMSFVCLNV